MTGSMAFAYFMSILVITLISMAVGYTLFKIIDFWEKWDSK